MIAYLQGHLDLFGISNEIKGIKASYSNILIGLVYCYDIHHLTFKKEIAYRQQQASRTKLKAKY